MNAGVQQPHDKLFRTVFSDVERRGGLPVIAPVVFYQEESEWRYSTEFADLFAEGGREMMAVYPKRVRKALRLAAPLAAQLTRTGGPDPLSLHGAAGGGGARAVLLQRPLV